MEKLPQFPVQETAEESPGPKSVVADDFIVALFFFYLFFSYILS